MPWRARSLKRLLTAWPSPQFIHAPIVEDPFCCSSEAGGSRAQKSFRSIFEGVVVMISFWKVKREKAHQNTVVMSTTNESSARLLCPLEGPRSARLTICLYVGLDIFIPCAVLHGVRPFCSEACFSLTVPTFWPERRIDRFQLLSRPRLLPNSRCAATPGAIKVLGSCGRSRVWKSGECLAFVVAVRVY